MIPQVTDSRSASPVRGVPPARPGRPEPVAPVRAVAPAARDRERGAAEGRAAWPQIARIFTAKRLLDVQSRLRTDAEWRRSKILWIVGTHGDPGAPSKQVYAYTDPDIALILAEDILLGRFARAWTPDKPFRVFGGSKGRPGQEPEARVFSAGYDPNKSNPYFFSAARYTGRVEANGRITPVQKLDEVTIFMDELSARKLAVHLRAFIQAWLHAMALGEIRRLRPEAAAATR